ncbi:hypothetical protein GBA52_026614 [Prunus armeniaca]|nr:hypothetical protein GBA52_026614 [Prunus armeniaca]
MTLLKTSELLQKVPKKFVMKYEENLSSPMRLELPSEVLRTEVQYPITKPEIEETDYKEEDDDKSIEILDGFRPYPRKAREKSPLPCPQRHKKMSQCGKA